MTSRLQYKPPHYDSQGALRHPRANKGAVNFHYHVPLLLDPAAYKDLRARLFASIDATVQVVAPALEELDAHLRVLYTSFGYQQGDETQYVFGGKLIVRYNPQRFDSLDIWPDERLSVNKLYKQRPRDAQNIFEF